MTPLPVIGVPVPLKHLDGLDSLLSIVQMPAGVPVATVSIGGARNAGLLAVRVLAAVRPRAARADAGLPGRARRHRPRQGRRPAGSGWAGSTLWTTAPAAVAGAQARASGDDEGAGRCGRGRSWQA